MMNKSRQAILTRLKYSYKALVRSSHYTIDYALVPRTFTLCVREENEAAKMIKEGLIVKLWNGSGYVMTEQGYNSFVEYLRADS